MTRWQRITATKGRIATFFGGGGLVLVLALVLPRPCVLGVPTGSYLALGVVLLWLVALSWIEARWRRQDQADADREPSWRGPGGT